MTLLLQVVLLVGFPLTGKAQIVIEPTPEQQKARLAFIQVTPKPQTLVTPVTFGEKVFAYAFKYGLDRDDVEDAMLIMKCESQYRPEAINKNNPDKSWDFGIWQINNKRWEKYLKDRGFDIRNPESNLEAGFFLLSEHGIKLWKPSNGCHKLLSKTA